jgi:hypothetical protein
MRHRKRALDHEMGSLEPLTAIETPGHGGAGRLCDT